MVVKVGSIWLAAMLYLTLSFFIIDLVRLGTWVIGSPLRFDAGLLVKARYLVYAATGLLLVGGYINPKIGILS